MSLLKPNNSRRIFRDPQGLRRNPLIWIAIIAAIVLFSESDRILPTNQSNTGELTDPLTTVGGPFELTDHTGRTVTNRDFLGNYMLIYFGYTWCPDICPVDVLVMSEAMEVLGEASTRVQPIFITVDPNRDTISSLSQFVSHFHPQLIALTGTEEQIAIAAKAYKVYFKKGEELESADDYLVDHTSFIYLMGPDGKFLEFFRRGLQPTEIALTIERYL